MTVTMTAEVTIITARVTTSMDIVTIITTAWSPWGLPARTTVAMVTTSTDTVTIITTPWSPWAQPARTTVAMVTTSTTAMAAMVAISKVTAIIMIIITSSRLTLPAPESYLLRKARAHKTKL